MKSTGFGHYFQGRAFVNCYFNFWIIFKAKWLQTLIYSVYDNMKAKEYMLWHTKTLEPPVLCYNTIGLSYSVFAGEAAVGWNAKIMLE